MNIYNMAARVNADSITFDVINDIEDVSTLLEACWMRFFGAPGENDAPKDNIVEIGVLLSVCCDRLRDALLRYKLAVGQGGSDVDAYFEDAEDFREIHELSSLYYAASDRERTLSGADRTALERKRLEISEMPPAAAIKALRELLKGGEA